jgi:hypothetical protein
MPRKRTISINRAPVLTLWAAIVAERLGFRREEALTLGRAVAGLNAYSKGVSLGLFKPSAKTVEDHRKKLKAGQTLTVDLLHRAVPVTRTPEGLRALSKERPISPDSVERYLQRTFGDALDDAHAAMMELARSLPPADIAARAYRLYELFRPEVPEGVKGWGAKGELDIGYIRSLGAERP